MALSWNKYNLAYNQYLDSQKAYDIAEHNASDAEQQLLTDYEAYQWAAVQFGGTIFASAAIWVYNMYDINKLRYLYTGEINQINYNVNLSPLGELKIQFHF